MKRILLGMSMVGVLVALMAGPAAADTISWGGNGTTGGVCNNVTNDPNLPAGTQNWLFVLTQANTKDADQLELRATFQSSGQVVVAPSKVNNKVVQFSVTTSADDALLSAEADNGNARNSVLTVSHCERNVAFDSCSPGYWRNHSGWQGEVDETLWNASIGVSLSNAFVPPPAYIYFHGAAGYLNAHYFSGYPFSQADVVNAVLAAEAGDLSGIDAIAATYPEEHTCPNPVGK